MKLILENRGIKYTIESDSEDMVMDEFYESCKNLAYIVGFHYDTVEEYFGKLD